MFAITPYHARAHVQHTDERTYEDCTVLGIDAGLDLYVVELRRPDGTFVIEKADYIRKLPPTARN